MDSSKKYGLRAKSHRAGCSVPCRSTSAPPVRTEHTEHDTLAALCRRKALSRVSSRLQNDTDDVTLASPTSWLLSHFVLRQSPLRYCACARARAAAPRRSPLRPVVPGPRQCAVPEDGSEHRSNRFYGSFFLFDCNGRVSHPDFFFANMGGLNEDDRSALSSSTDLKS